jgi:SAM-dependent methyltransferase
MVGKIFFTIRYLLDNMPWDTGITPPEVYQFLDTRSPGKALDLGCGTGTNVITIAEYGWQVTGVDYVPQAIRIARRKARKAGVKDAVRFLAGSVLTPDFMQDEYDLILDIGCFHSFRGEDVHRYARNIPLLLTPGGRFLVYVHLADDAETDRGASEDGILILEENLTLINRVNGRESDKPSAWLEFGI